VTLRVFQGEREMAADNKLLGNFDLTEIPGAPRGVPQIEVTFDIDANGIVNVSAKDKGTGREQKIQIQASSGLSEDDIEKMVKDAEEHAAEDKARKEKVEVVNQADSLVHATEKTLEEAGDKVGDDVKAPIESALTELKEAKDGDDVDAIKAKMEALQAASMKLGEALYAQSQGEAEGGSEEGSGQQESSSSDDDVVDADFEEVDDDKKDK
jgi:molecular chaperone DnaK